MFEPPVSTPDRANHGRRRIAKLLVRLVGERHLWSDGDRVPGVHAHGVEVLDRADDDDVVGAIADHLELELVPAPHGLLHQHLADRRLRQPALDLTRERGSVVGKASSMSSERERGAHDGGQGHVSELVERRHDSGGRHLEATAQHCVSELLPILRASDHLDRRADQLHPEVFEHARPGELDRKIERCLSAQRGQERVRTLPLQHRGDALEIERLDVGAVGEARVGHDRGRVRVDDDRAVSVLPQDLQRLTAGIVELAGLADDDRARADHAHALEVAPRRH